MHSEIGQCTSDCRHDGCPEEYICSRCDKSFQGKIYWVDDQNFCADCYGLLEYRAEVAWEAYKEQELC